MIFSCLVQTWRKSCTRQPKKQAKQLSLHTLMVACRLGCHYWEIGFWLYFTGTVGCCWWENFVVASSAEPVIQWNLPKSTQKTNICVFLGRQVEEEKSWGCLGEAVGSCACCLNTTSYRPVTVIREKTVLVGFILYGLLAGVLLDVMWVNRNFVFICW